MFSEEQFCSTKTTKYTCELSEGVKKADLKLIVVVACHHPMQ